MWERIADEVADIDDLTVGRFNGKLNEIPTLKVGGYPTIIMMPRGESSRIISYDGQDLDFESIKKWVWTYSEVYREHKQAKMNQNPTERH